MYEVCEDLFSFILKVKLITVKNCCIWTYLVKETEGNLEIVRQLSCIFSPHDLAHVKVKSGIFFLEFFLVIRELLVGK